MEILADLSERCDNLRSPGPINLIVSIFILVGMLISYLPQHYRIISRGTSEGISPYFVLLGVTSATSGFANILTLPQSRQDVACCKDLDTFHCLAGLLGIAQLGVQWISFAFILVLFLVFFRFDPAHPPADEIDGDDAEELHRLHDENAGEQPGWQTAVMVACVCFIHGLLVIIITAIIGYVFPAYLSAWANALGIMAAALAGVQYLPQIWTTYHLKHVGSLSIPMMCIQTPGGFLFAGSLFARLGWEGWSSWGIFLLTALMQGVLLCMGIYFEMRRHGHKMPELHDPAEERLLDESEALDERWGGGGRGEGRTAPAYSPGVSPGLVDGASSVRQSAHPDQQVQNGIDQQDADGATETQPLLKNGGKNGTVYRT